MKRLLVYITVMLLFSVSAVFLAGEGGCYGPQPYGSESGSNPQAQGSRPDPGSQKSDGLTSVGEGARSSYQQEGTNNAVKSRWQIDMGGFVGMGVGHRE